MPRTLPSTLIVRGWLPLVYNWCRQRGVKPHDATDVVQEVFQAVSVNIARFRRDRPEDSFRGWLRTITRMRKTSD